MNRRYGLKALLVIAALMSASQVFSQSTAWPNRPIKMIVPFAPGVSPDVVARIIADKLSQSLGQPVVVDNRPGAGGMIAGEAAALSPADGYTTFFTVKAVMAIAPNVYRNAKFNPIKDFKPVAQILTVPHIITAAPNTSFNTMQELVDYAKRNPGKLDYASLGVGSQPHVAMATWANKLGIELNHVPYKTNPAADVMAGVVQLSLEASTTAIPSIKGGKVKGIAISGPERLAVLPNVPTVTEYRADLDPNGVIGSSWHAVFVPAATPPEVINRLNAEIVKIVKTAEVQEKLLGLGLTPTGSSAAYMSSVLSTDYDYWGKLIKGMNIQLD
jgi:tripartite-type tricarboxylate transporter receptor subunit TctC